MKRTLFSFFILLLSLSLLGNPVDEATAKQLAQNFWKENNIMGVRGDKVFKKKMGDARFANVAPQCGYSEFYIFNNEDGKGFVIIAADDCVTPVLGYSYDNRFTTENLPPNLKGWLDGYAEQIQTAVEMRVTATDEVCAEWECLRQGKNLPVKSETQVNPLIVTTWGQDYPYNELCPNDAAHFSRTLTGCVATAMAQIMKYWSYPEHGIGSHSYIPTNHPEYGTQYADFSSTTYQWTSMPNNVTSSNNAVATLMYHCGVSVDMNYDITSNGGSGAYVLDFGLNRPCAENALKTYFDYKSTLHGEVKDDYSDSQWIALLKNELNNARPILYAGYGTGGHAFVCDGYDPYDCFHFNWGWSGTAQGTNNDAYYYINSLIPEGTAYNFSSNQQALIGIEPNNTTYNFDLVYHCTPIMSDDEYGFFDDLSVYAEVLNNGSGAFNGYIGAGVYYEEVSGSGTYYFLNIMDYWNRTASPLPGTYYVYGDLDCAGGPPYIPGSYAIAMLYSMNGDLWNFIDLGNYDYAYFDITSSHRINVGSEFTILTGDGTCLYQNTDATVNVDVKNTGSDTFYGQFRISLLNSTGNWMQTLDVYDCTNGLQPNYHYTNGLDFTGLITVAPGTYLMSVDYKESGTSSWYYAGASDYQNPVWVYVAPEPVYADPYEPNNSQNLAYLFTPYFSGNSATVNTTGSNLHNSSDDDYYKINLNTGYDYTIIPRLHDAFNSGNGYTYSVDGMFAYSIDGVNWSDFYDDVMTGNFSVIDGGTVYFDVISYFEGDIGTYLLSVGITRTQHTNSYTISVSANPSNGGIVSGGGTYNQGQSCTVQATANTGFAFVNWTENGTQVSTNASYTFTVTGDRNLVAHFATQSYVISAIADPTAGGVVTGSGGYNYGETCTLTATPNTGYTFQRWTKNGTQVSTNPTYSFTVTESATYTAHFNAQSYTITVAANPNNAGNVSGGGSYTYGQTCTVNASANNSYAFTNWTENGTQVSTNANYSFTVTGNRNLVANFAQNAHTIQASAGANGIITPSGTVTVAHGANQSFSMIPDSDYEVQEVYIDGNPVGAMSSYTFSNVIADHYIHVTFVHVDAVAENNTNNISVYPNPTKGGITVEGEGISHIRVVNVYGQIIYETEVNDDQVHIDFTGIAQGFYMMHIEANGRQSVRKVVVE